jgi:hypothetical protein
MTIRYDSNKKIGDVGVVYEFNVKLSMRIRGLACSEMSLSFDTEQAVDACAADLRHRYPWIGDVCLTGRSNGWLACTDREGRATEDKLKRIDVLVVKARRAFEDDLIARYGFVAEGGIVYPPPAWTSGASGEVIVIDETTGGGP